MFRSNFISFLTRIIHFSQIHRLFFWIWDRVEYCTSIKDGSAKIAYSGPKKRSRLAILAIFQTKGLSDFVKHQVDFIISLGYDIVVSVPHSLNQVDQDFLDGRCRFRIMRPNRGRDFGSYRDAVLQVGFNHIKEYGRVLLINDSVFFPIGPTKQFIEEFDSAVQRYDLVGLTENSKSIRHIASFFIDIHSDIFCSPASQHYWKKYKLYNSRFHAIRQGECGLSKILYREASSIHLLYSKERIIDLAYHDFNRIIDPKRSIYLLSDIFWKNKKKNFLSVCFSNSNQEERISLFVDALARILETSSVPHSFGLHLIELFGAPFLKRDIYYHDIYDLAQIHYSLKNKINNKKLESIILELRKRGSARNQSVWQELMIRIGVR